MSVLRRLVIPAALVSAGALLAAAAAAAAPSGSASSNAGVHLVGLGKVVTSRGGGQIFGWDIDENGNDGLLATARDTGRPGVYRVSVETFDQRTAKVVASFARSANHRDSYLVDGIVAGDVGLVTHYVVPHGSSYAKRRYNVLDPVTANAFTGDWTPPLQDFDVQAVADNQQTSTSVLFGIELKAIDDPDLVVSDVGSGTVRAIPLDPDLFGLADGPQLAQDLTSNEAVLAFSPDGGAVGGVAPRFGIVDLDTGDTTYWDGLNGGPVHAGYVNGLAVDSAAGTAATTTELNAQVEFYNLKRHTGIAVQLPGTTGGDQLDSGAAVACDPVHGLFLVADPVYAPTGDSAIVVYDEEGDLVEAIPGFDFSNASTVVAVRVAVNPARRVGWVDGPGPDQIQQFHY